MSPESTEAPVAEPRTCPVVHGFDPMGDEFQASPGMALARAREEEPIFYDPDLDYYVVTRYADIRAVFVDTKSFSPGIATEPIAPICPAAQEKLKEHDFRKVLTLGVTEEPLHMQLRKRLDDPFSNEAVAEWEPMVREVMTSYIDRFVKLGRADLIDDLIHEAPAVVALAFLGVPDEDIEQTKKFAQGILKFVFGYPTEEEQVQVCDHMGEHQHFSDHLVKEMIEDTPEKGFLPHAVRVFLEEPEGSPFNEDFLSGLAMNGLAAAHETTSNSAANAFHLLLTNRDSWERVCAEPSLIPGAVEECLRMGLSQCTWRRLCVKDKVIGGVKIPAGGRVLLVLASGNFDEEMFPEPETFDIERSNAVRQLAFGIGAHRCLGAGLAKLQMKVMIEQLGQRLPHMRLVEGQKIEYLRTAARGGPLHLLVEWDPAQNPVPEDRP